jgi:hypothetical protein
MKEGNLYFNTGNRIDADVPVFAILDDPTCRRYEGHTSANFDGAWFYGTINRGKFEGMRVLITIEKGKLSGAKNYVYPGLNVRTAKRSSASIKKAREVAEWMNRNSNRFSQRRIS